MTAPGDTSQDRMTGLGINLDNCRNPSGQCLLDGSLRSMVRGGRTSPARIPDQKAEVREGRPVADAE